MLDPYINLSLADRLQLLAFEAELAHLPRSLAAVWDAFDTLTGIGGDLVLLQAGWLLPTVHLGSYSTDGTFSKPCNE